MKQNIKSLHQNSALRLLHWIQRENFFRKSLLAVLLAFPFTACLNAAEVYTVTSKGQATCSIVTSQAPSEVSKEAARILSEYLQKNKWG